MKTKQIFFCALIVSLIFGYMRGMKKEPYVPKIIQKKIEKIWKKKTKHHTHFIKFHTTNFPVSKKDLEKFKLYKTQMHFHKGQRTKQEGKVAHQLVKSTIQKPLFLPKKEFAPVLLIKEKIGKPVVIWDITLAISHLMSKLPSEKEWKLFTKLIKLLVGVASKKIDPYEIKDKNTLFMIVKVADLLRNKSIMQACTPALIAKFVPNLIVNTSTRTFNHNSVDKIKILPNQQFFSYSHSDNTIKLWNINQKNPIRTFNHYSVDGIKILPNKQFLSHSYIDNNIKLWNINQKNPIRTFNHNRVKGIKILSNKQFLSHSASDNNIKLWNINQKNPIRTFNHKWVKGIKILSNKQFLSHSDSDNTIKLWDINQKNPIRTFKHNSVKGIKILPNKQFLSHSASDNTIKLWNINPFTNLTFKQINLFFKVFTEKTKYGIFGYTVFTRKKILTIEKGDYDYETFKSLPVDLQKAIEKSGHVNFVGQEEEKDLSKYYL